MEGFKSSFFDFIIEAKRHTYAAGGPPTGSCREGSKDIGYAAGGYEYLDSFFGATDFLGEEVVYKDKIPIWGMNYYGRSIADADSDSMGEILHAALMEPPRDAPYRGPRSYIKGDYEYLCSWKGEVVDFYGKEEILHKGKRIYSLRFHGGAIA